MAQQGRSDDEIDDEVEFEVELNEDEAPFLRNQTTKGGVYLSPIKVVKVPDGTLERAAMNSKGFAKERRDLREEKRRAVIDNLPKEHSKYWEDPNQDNYQYSLAISRAKQGFNPLTNQEKINWRLEARKGCKLQKKTNMTLQE